ncbi:dTDP-4-dehydrorhamnose 3,5-epimerase [Sediminibacterium soli]|uniref:dTDP-4-dehydrorhamnose 3,5-epimerase n=1 Tax=Sediminibacterium soli TaxID=2698829 RepID=UPI00137A5F49|nr:dTDP-4-dehydrorhamnose 3,5-epimerase [Sediminibacterium soli]NCI45391.1 dTDP-4-dehydrorhamnose 3,5-epimerase [Sediminibacterium soli]
MYIEQTALKDCFIVHDSFIGDARGYFFESFNKRTFQQQTGITVEFVQDNQSSSQRGVLRGLHFQYGEYAQAKLVRVLKGRVLDIAVDLRKSSPSFGQHISVELSEESHTQFYVPRGFAHGFVVLSDTATFFYKCDNFYNKSMEGGIIYNDADLGIDWEMQPDQLVLSDKDKVLPCLKDIVDKLHF